MSIVDYFKIAFKNLRTRPIRTWLTILGIVIGVFLIVAVVSLGEGMRMAVARQLQMVGGDVIMVMPGDMADMMVAMIGGLMLTDDDLRTIERTEGVKLVIPMPWQTDVVRHQGETRTVMLAGISMEEEEFFKEHMGWYLTEGRWPMPERREIIVGAWVPIGIFSDLEIEDYLLVRGRRLRVTGILRSLGNRTDDSTIALDLSVFRDITGVREGSPVALVQISPNFTSGQVVTNIQEALGEGRRLRRGEELPPYTVMDMEATIAMVGNIMLLIQVVIFGLSSIALVVSGIGIMNTMYTSVFERTKEIGVMKAIGAKKATISNIFLIESGVMGLVGGIGGVILGVGLAQAIEFYLRIHPVFYLEASITPQLIIFGLAFAFLVGCISGYLPARRASQMKPVDALRYE